MNATAKQTTDTFRTWNRQWSDAALAALNAHEQFVGDMVNAFNKPMNLDGFQAPIPAVIETSREFAANQMLEGEKFMTNVMRKGLKKANDMINDQPELGSNSFDAQQARKLADDVMQDSVRTASEMAKMEVEFLNDRMNDTAEFTRSMMNMTNVNDNAGTKTANGKKKVTVNA